MSVLKGRHEFNRKIRNGKRNIIIFPAGGDPMLLPRTISFQVVSKSKRWFWARYKTQHMLGESCPEVTPTPEDSGTSFIEQWYFSGESSSCRTWVFCQDFSFWKISDELLCSCGGEWWGEFLNRSDYSSDSDSGSGSESGADTDSQLESLAAPEIPWEKPSIACLLRNTHLWLRRPTLIWSQLGLTSQRLICPWRETKKQRNHPRMNLLTTNNRYVKYQRYILHGSVTKIQI